jgi:hypothetical protein
MVLAIILGCDRNSFSRSKLNAALSVKADELYFTLKCRKQNE